MSQIIELRYERVKNLGHYETERLSFNVILDDEDSVEEVFKSTKEAVLKLLDLVDDEE